MIPQQFVTQNNDKIIGSGQCGELIDLALVEIYGNHTSYATALDYWTNGIPGFSVVVGAPQDGDITCYNAHPGYPDGHISMHFQGEEFEQNADPDGSPAHLFPRATTYLLGYLRSEVMETFNEGDRVNLNNYLYGKDNGYFQAQVGIDWKTAMYQLFTSGSQFDFDYKTNSGDVVNINKELGTTDAPQGWNFKDLWYSYLIGDNHLPTGSNATVLPTGTYKVE